MREFDLIQRFFDRPTSQRQVCLGIGDDGAILQVPEAHELVVVTDTLVEGVHFRATDAPDDLGYKAPAVNLSDLAAICCLYTSDAADDTSCVDLFSTSDTIYNIHL